MTIQIVSDQYKRLRRRRGGTRPIPVQMMRAVRWEEVDRRNDRATVGCFATILLAGLASVTAPFAAVGWGWV
ncbi:hypothetical protein B1813_18835 [Saccharomonospora piscinae]|uniref:Uncharacterized protein n=1 Tax=Saccharomonospora piscinae TaxID=687388 RepID=A0A1V8ZY99_SACPI|nr:hypothetical protein [Saccharomonospora piscinae]OQO89899.1 hypothetical protein B1813_18835 [Saccharomonospora piscinae]